MTTRITLVAKLDTEAAEELATTLIASRGSDLVLDASAVEQLGAFAVQVLIVAARDWESAGNTLTLEGLPDEIESQLAEFGLPPAQFMTVEAAA